MVLSNVQFRLQKGFRIVSAVIIPKKHLWQRMGYIVIFNRLAGIPNIALLVPPIVHVEVQKQ